MKIRLSAAALILILVLTGCGGNNSDKTGDADNGSAVKEEAGQTGSNGDDAEAMSVINIRAAKEGELSDGVIMKVGEAALTHKEALVYMISRKEEAESLYGNDIWSYVLHEDGTTYEEMLKEQILDELIYLQIVCSKADELGISLTEDEKMDVDEYTIDYLMNFTDEQMTQYGLDGVTVKKMYTDNVLANKIYESLTLNVDTSVPDVEAMQSVFYYILLPKYSYDTEGNYVEFNEKELEDMKEYAEEVYAKAQEGTDFYTLAKASTYDSDEIVITTGRSDMLQEFADRVFALEEGEMTEILENESGYFIFYCKTKYDVDATDAKKEAIILERQNEVFMESYENWKQEAEIIIDYELWESIHF